MAKKKLSTKIKTARDHGRDNVNEFYFVQTDQGELQLGGKIGSIAGSFLPIPGGSILGGVAGNFIENLIEGQQEPESEFEPNIIKPVNPYTNARPIQPRQQGGRITRYKGPSHEEGGMDIGPAEVEDGENEFDMVVNSDTKKITKRNVRQYGIDGDGRVPIYKRHIGKTPAEVGEEIDNRYKKFFPYDPFLVSDKEYLGALSDMSEELADELQVNGRKFLKSGGRWRPKTTRMARNRKQEGGELGDPPEGPLFEQLGEQFPEYGKLRQSTYKHGLGERFDALSKLRNYQGKLTGKFAETYPDVPVEDILREAQGAADPMSILNTSSRGEEQISELGDLSLSPDDIDEFLGEESTEYWDLLNKYTPQGTVGQDEDVITRQKFGMRSMIMPRLRSDAPKTKGQISIGMGPYQFLEDKAGGGKIKYEGGGSLSASKAKKMLRDNSANDRTLSPRQKRFFGWVAGGRKKQRGGNLFMDPEGQFKPGTALGLAPIATNLLQLGLESGREEREYDYPTVQTEEFEPLDPSQEVARTGEGFDTAMEGLRRSGSLTPAAMIQLATERGKATGDVFDRYNRANIQGRNRRYFVNQQSRRFNAMQRTRGIIDTAADEGAGLTRRSAFLSGVGSGLGQLGRDINLAGAQSRGLDRYYDFMERAFPNYFKNQEGQAPTEEDSLSEEELEYDLYG